MRAVRVLWRATERKRNDTIAATDPTKPMKHAASSPRRLHIAALLAAALACGFAVRPSAASSYQINGVVQFSYGSPLQVTVRDSFNQTSSSSLSDTALHAYDDGNATQVGQLDARAAFGSVGISGSSSYAMGNMGIPSTLGINFAAAGTARATFTDVVITGTGSSLSTRLRLHLGGVVNSTSSPTPLAEGTYGGAGVSFAITVNGNTVGFGSLSRTSTNGGAPQISTAGLFAGFTGNSVVTTGSFSVPLNTPFTLQLEISTKLESIIQGGVTGSATASSGFYNSLSFATTQPVFDLPAGYTAHSTDGGIVNNGYIPEPGTFALLLLAAPATLLRRRRPAAFTR